uniref:Partial AB-hydrolase lipase domain-containing protein n=1 Tax=Megaselia scalaris TaxID=36166 RepID=T1GDZ5_MEGSC
MKRITLLVCFSVPFALAGDSLFDTSSSTAVSFYFELYPINPSAGKFPSNRSHGFPVEEHSVQTEDGYILSIHRIPKANGSVVFLQHGLLSSSGDWLIIGPQKALAFVLSNQGYDVWMGNARGNTYSRKHKTLSPESSNFWNFDWHEIALYDIPAMINYVLNKTKQRKLNMWVTLKERRCILFSTPKNQSLAKNSDLLIF